MQNKHPLLRMADEAAGTIVDPLDTNVSDIDTTYPRLQAKLYDLKISKAEVKEMTMSGVDHKVKRLQVTLETTAPATSTDGDELAPGHKLTHFITVETLPARKTKDGKADIAEYTNESIKKGIASLAKPAGVVASVRAIIDNPSILEGKIVRTKVGISPETNEYPESNNIKQFVEIK